MMVFLKGLEDNMPFEISDLMNLRLVNREMKTEIDRDKMHVMRVLRKQLLMPIECIMALTNSDFSYPEVDNIITTWKNLCNRKYGEKYGMLLKRSIIKECSKDPIIIKNNYYVFFFLYNHALYWKTRQQYAPTDIVRYIMYWISDYTYFIYNLLGKECNHHLSDILNKDFHDLMSSKRTILFWYDIFAILLRSNGDLPSILIAKDVIEMENDILILLHFCKYCDNVDIICKYKSVHYILQVIRANIQFVFQSYMFPLIFRHVQEIAMDPNTMQNLQVLCIDIITVLNDGIIGNGI